MRVPLSILPCLVAFVAACGARVSPDRDALASIDASTIDAVDVPLDRTEPRDARPPLDASTPDAGACGPLNERSIRAPNVVVSGERAPLAAVAQSAGCGCRPTVVTRGPSDYALRACDCSNSDPCVDPSYVVNWDDDATTTVAEATVEQVRIGTLNARFTRLPRDYRCTGAQTRIQAGGVTIETDNDARTSGPRRVWAYVRGATQRCSGDPLTIVTKSGSNPIVLNAADCNNSDCDGPTSPRPFGVWVMLGEFVPGSYSIFHSPGTVVRFDVR
ncbi:MAG: hypothetical protein JNK05_22550 [Myxococcales bacterium]|nr:hypothetical protein [Myxococcales bacterium]